MGKHRGYRTDQASTDRFLSPHHPYTGDGKTRRQMASGLRMETRNADGTKTEKDKK